MALSEYQKQLALIRSGQAPKTTGPKPKKPIAKQSPKKKAELKEQKEALAGDDSQKEKWFKNRRKEMIGICQCGCGKPSQKKDDMYFRHSACHIFPKSKFESIQYNKLNFVERAFFGGCHSVMDDTSMDKWPNMADWEDVKEKFHQIAPLLTPEERSTKFYSHLESLIYKN